MVARRRGARGRGPGVPSRGQIWLRLLAIATGLLFLGLALGDY